MNISNYDNFFSSHSFHVVPEISCKDGFKFSVQSSKYHACIPSNDLGPWSHFEVGFPSEKEELLDIYETKNEVLHGRIFEYVPKEIVMKIIEKHGGIEE